MAKAPDADDMKEMGSDATKAIGPMKKLVDDAFKLGGMMVKNPNPKVAESLADKVEEIIESANDMKSLLKDLKAASK